MRKFSKKRRNQVWLLVWSLIRLGAVSLLWLNAAFGVVVNVLLDAVDGDMFERLGLKRKNYEVWDKWMDLWLLMAMAIYSYYYWERDVVWYAMMFVFSYRFIGQLVYGIGKREGVLMIFPSLVTEIFFLKEVIPFVFNIDLAFGAPWSTFVVLAAYGLFKEWWLHIVKLDVSNMLFGRSRW